MFETVTTRFKSTHCRALKPQLLPKELQYVCAAGFKGGNSWAIKQMQPVQFCICRSQSEEAHEEEACSVEASAYNTDMQWVGDML